MVSEPDATRIGSTVLLLQPMEKGSKDEPTHDLARIKTLVQARRYHATSVVRSTLFRLDLTECDLVECVARLDGSDFYKSMPSDLVPGSWQDVYRPGLEGRRMYVKLLVNDRAEVVIVQFKER